MRLVWLCVHKEVLIAYDHLLFPVILRFLFQGELFGHHVIPRDEDGVKEFSVGESLDTFDLRDEVGSASIVYVLLCLGSESQFSLQHLQVVRHGRQ